MIARGFTLVEMLVAIGLMALMAIICWRGLAYVADQRVTVARESVELSRLMRTFAQIERDLTERLPNAALPAAAMPTELPLALEVRPLERGAAELEIVRFLPEPAGAAHALRVRYRIGAGGLERSTRPPEGALVAANSEVLLLPGATALQVRIHAGGFWVQPGHDTRVQPAAPATAIELAIEDAAGARYVKVLPL